MDKTDDSLKAALENFGLNASKWYPLLQEIGIHNVSSLQYMEFEDYESVISKGSKIEKRALQDFFERKGIKGDKKGNENAKAGTLKTLQSMTETSASTPRKHSVKSEEMHTLDDRMAEPYIKSPKYENEKLPIAEIRSDIFPKETKIGKIDLKTCPCEKEKELVSNALSVIHVYQDDHKSEYEFKGQCLYSDDIKLHDAVIGCKEITEDFANERDQEKFKRRLEFVNITVSSHCAFDENGARLTHNRSKVKTITEQQSRKEKFYSLGTIYLAQAKSLFIKQKNIRLPDELVADLQKLDFEKNSNDVYMQLKKHIRTHGSHVSTGTIYVGSICEFRTTYRGNSKYLFQEIKTITIKEHAAEVKVMTGTFGSGIDGSFETSDDIREDESLVEISSNIRKSFHVKGGPASGQNFHEWRKMVFEHPESWTVISRGSLVGIWDIIIENPHGLSNYLDIALVTRAVWMDEMGKTEFEKTTYVIGEYIQAALHAFDKKSKHTAEELEVIIDKLIKVAAWGKDFGTLNLTPTELFKEAISLAKTMSIKNRFKLKVLLCIAGQHSMKEDVAIANWFKKEPICSTICSFEEAIKSIGDDMYNIYKDVFKQSPLNHWKLLINSQIKRELVIFIETYIKKSIENVNDCLVLCIFASELNSYSNEEMMHQDNFSVKSFGEISFNTEVISVNECVSSIFCYFKILETVNKLCKTKIKAIKQILEKDISHFCERALSCSFDNEENELVLRLLVTSLSVSTCFTGPFSVKCKCLFENEIKVWRLEHDLINVYVADVIFLLNQVFRKTALEIIDTENKELERICLQHWERLIEYYRNTFKTNPELQNSMIFEIVRVTSFRDLNFEKNIKKVENLSHVTEVINVISRYVQEKPRKICLF